MPKEFWRHTSRGRRSKSVHPYNDTRTLEYLAIIAIRNNIDSSEFLDCIREAYDQEESECEQLSVRCRQKTEDSAVFLFTLGQDVIAQFPISTGIFEREEQLTSCMRTMSARKSSTKKVMNLKIKDLRAGMRQVNLKAEVLFVPEPNVVYTRFGTQAYVSNALIGDETGTIRIALWNKQITEVSKGDVVEIENGEVSSFKGELQIRIGRSGSLTVIK